MSTGIIEIEFALNVPKRRSARTNGVRPTAPDGRIPRISKLMALAIKFEGTVARGEVEDYADLARLGHVTRARMSQIMNLVNLAPDIQEEILFLPKTEVGRAPVNEAAVRQIACQPLWKRQRYAWRTLRDTVCQSYGINLTET
jgi:hypothetical protein